MVGYNFTNSNGTASGEIRIIALIPEAVTAWDNLAYRRATARSCPVETLHNLTLAVTSSPGYDILLVRRDHVV
jgi:hypothetical protein